MVRDQLLKTLPAVRPQPIPSSPPSHKVRTQGLDFINLFKEIAVSSDQVEHTRFISPCCQPYHHSPLKPDFSLPLFSLQNASHFVYAMGKIYNLFKCIDSINIKQIILNRQQKQKPFCWQSLLWVTQRQPLCTSCCTLACRSDTSKRLFLHPLIIQPSLWVHCRHHAISRASAVINCSFICPAIVHMKHLQVYPGSRSPHYIGQGQCSYALGAMPVYLVPEQGERKKDSLSPVLFTAIFPTGNSAQTKGAGSFWEVSVHWNGGRNNTNNKLLLMAASFRHCCMESHLNQRTKGEGLHASWQTS